jgi:Aspartyl/Asparaginyl beta-hydroxylase
MKGYDGNIEPFWLDELNVYVAEHITPIAPHAIPHVNYEGTMLKQSFNDQLPSCWPLFYERLQVEEGSVCWLTLEPKEVIPVHRDYFYMLKTKKNVDITDCIRYLIMLEDWKPGHMVQLDDLILTDWQAGDVWYFDSDVAHWAANCGTENFYSCQVSTVK